MKTKTFFLICFFLGIGLTQLSAQPDNKKGTGTVSFDVIWDGYWQPISCGGVVDIIYGTTIVHNVMHYVDGNPIWVNCHASGVAISERQVKFLR